MSNSEMVRGKNAGLADAGKINGERGRLVATQAWFWLEWGFAESLGQRPDNPWFKLPHTTNRTLCGPPARLDVCEPGQTRPFAGLLSLSVADVPKSRNPGQPGQGRDPLTSAHLPFVARCGWNSDCCAAETHAARGYSHDSQMYGDVVTNEMAEAHSKVVRMAMPRAS